MATELDLRIKSVIGFSGKTNNSLHYTDCGRYVVYPLGTFVVIKNIKTERESFLDGHTHDVSCIKLSKDGAKIASGQRNFPGVKADVIVWNLTEAKRLCDCGMVMIGSGCLLRRLRQHLTMIQDMDFSKNSDYLSTVGGEDDNTLIVWRLSDGAALCGSPAATDSVQCCKWLNNRNDRIVTGGYYHIRVWQIDFSLPKLHPVDAKMGVLRRVVQCIAISADDHTAYCGSTTGDIIKVKIDRSDIHSPNDPDSTFPCMIASSRERFSLGVKCIQCVESPSGGHYRILVGAGDGTVAYIQQTLAKVPEFATVMGGVTSMCVSPNGNNIIVGTDLSNKYVVSIDLSKVELKMSCHYGPAYDIAFPHGCPDLVLTSSVGDIRVWNVRSKQELLRIQVPNLECLCCQITKSGSTIISGWNDGKIRAFYPETGRMKFVITDAHADKVTALAICDDDSRSPWRIVSGGAEGKVRVWNISSSHQALVVSLKEHRGPVNAIKVNKDSTQCVSASSDGSCIVWDLERYVRITAFFEPNIFTGVLYHPDESQILTCGSNHKITYWDATDGQAIRVIDGAEDVMTGLDIEPSGEFFISCAEDRLVKIWHYDDGITAAVGRGHSGAIRAIKISPDQSQLVSVGSSGEIIFWEMPQFSKLRAKIDEIMGGDVHHK